MAASAFAASLAVVFTPGPNNIIVAAIGATRGFWRAMPYAMGVVAGFPIVLAAVGFGLGGVLRLMPQLQVWTQAAGALFLVYLAWRIAAAPPRDFAAETQAQNAGGKAARAPGFWQSLFFQWINPKGVSYAFSLIAVYARPQALAVDVPLLMLVTAFLSLASTVAWTTAGVIISRWLATPKRQRIFNGVMGALLLAAAANIFLR